MNDLPKAAIGGIGAGRFLQQLRSMANRRQRVANFMGDAGGQSTQCRQLELLQTFGGQFGIFQQHQDILIALPRLAQLGKAGDQFRPVIGRTKGGRFAGRAALPVAQALPQRRR